MRKTKNAAGFSSPAASKSTQKNSYQDYTMNPDKSKGQIHRNPIRLHRQPDNLPAALKRLHQWCLSGHDKTPLTAAGYKMDVTDPSNYLSFDEATAAAAKLTCAAGVGFILTGSNVVVVDVDHCIAESGELSDVAMELMGLLPTYTELSQSKTGLHLIYLDNQIPADFSGRKGVVEIYSNKRSITLHLTDKILPDELTTAIWEDIVNQHCGWAGKVFVDSLRQVDIQQLKQRKLECYQQLKQHFPNHHDDHLRYVALEMVTEQLVNQYIFQQPDDSAGTAVDILSQLEVKSALNNAEKEWEHLISWVTKENRHFKNNPTYDTSDICYGEYKKDCLVIIKSVLSEEFERWSHGKLKIDKILDDLYSAGYILGYHKNGRQTPLKIWSVMINNTKNIPAIKVDLKLITDEPIRE